MNSKGKGIITAVIVVLIALAAFCGFGYHFHKAKKRCFILRRRGSLSDGRVWESYRDL